MFSTSYRVTLKRKRFNWNLYPRMARAGRERGRRKGRRVTDQLHTWENFKLWLSGGGGAWSRKNQSATEHS